MNSFSLTMAITFYANMIACCVDEQLLDLIASICTQLGDTLATISATRSLCQQDVPDKPEEPEDQSKEKEN